jgi:hypothetical protein
MCVRARVCPCVRLWLQVVLEVTEQQEPAASPVFKTVASVLGVAASAEASRKKLSEAKAFEMLCARLAETPSAAVDIGHAGKSAHW